MPMTTSPTISDTLRRGQKLARAGKLDEALAAFDRAGEATDYRLHLHHALTLASAGRTDEAWKKSAQAVEAAPEDVVPMAFHAYLLLRNGRLDDATATLKRARELPAENPLVPSLEAACDVLAGQVAEGCSKLLAGPVTDNLNVLGWILATVEAALFRTVGVRAAEGTVPPETERRGDAAPDSDEVARLSPKRCLSRGEKAIESGRPHQAVAYLERAAAALPEEMSCQTMYGAALFECEQFEASEATLAKVPSDSPMAGVAQFYRAAASYRLGRYETALELLDTLPMKGDVFFYQEWFDYIRAMALVALGRTDAAVKHLAAFIDIEPETVERRLKKAVALLKENTPCSTPC
jgi:tetratricopeptide (TPR) repeat protein